MSGSPGPGIDPDRGAVADRDGPARGAGPGPDPRGGGDGSGRPWPPLRPRLGQRLGPCSPTRTPDLPELLRAVVPVLAQWEWRSGRSPSSPCRRVDVHSRRVVRRGIAISGRLRDLGSLDYAHGGPTGEAGGNSAFRLAGVWDRIVVGAGVQEQLAGIPGPVLLVDDVVDSRWSLTVAARALRLAGAPAVLPLALAVEG